MAFAITNKAQMNPAAPGQPGVLHYELADQAAAGTLTDTGIAGLKFIRVRGLMKSGITNGENVLFKVKVDDNGALASPETVAQTAGLLWITGDTNLTFEVNGWSQTGFRYFKIVGTDSAGASVTDFIVDCW